jgi:hypothetical protein
MPDNFMQSYVSGYAAGEYLKWGAAAAKQKTELDNEKLGLEVKASENELDAYTKQAALAKLAAEPPKPGELPKGAVEIQTDYRDRLARAGFVVASLDVSKKLYDNQKVVSDVQDKTLERADKGYARIAREMPAIHSDAEWKAFGRDHQALYPEAVEGPENYMRMQQLFATPWTPELTDHLYRGAVTRLEEVQVQREEAAARSSNAQAALAEARRKQLPAELKMKQERADALNKHTGDAGPKATKVDRSLAANLISGEYDVPADQLYVLSTAVANRAAEIESEQPRAFKPMEKSAAIRAAYAELKAKHTFVGLDAKEPDEGSRAAPAPMPVKSGKIDAGSLEQNKVYQGTGKYAGKSLVWNGKGFEVLEDVEPGSDVETPPEDLGEGGEE